MRFARPLAAAAAAVCLSIAPASSSLADAQYVYDSAGRLIKVTYSNGVVIEYRYDASGNRRQVVTSTVPNRAPVASNDSASVPTSGVVDIAVRSNDADPDGDALTITSVSSPGTGGGTTSIVSGKVRYTAPTTAGVRTFTYTVADPDGLTDSATVTVTVTSSNQPPVATDDWAFASPGGTTPIMVLANDTDPNNNTLTVTAVTAPSGGSATVAPGGGYVVYTAPATPGSYSFTYTASDGAGGTDTATVNVTVEAYEDPCANTPPGEMCEIGV